MHFSRHQTFIDELSTNSNIMSATEEQQKAEKEKSVPKDAQVMISILKDMGINEFEPRVVNQMLEFSYRCLSLHSRPL